MAEINGMVRPSFLYSKFKEVYIQFSPSAFKETIFTYYTGLGLIFTCRESRIDRLRYGQGQWS
jgi:hypothetical protein